ncbi:MAG TPA: ABC transporter permease [Gemmataceae bacterium]|nr:ABC transporter permease [Gemmataceae bacterium]
MAPIWTLAKKEFRLLLRDPRAAVLLLGMPLLFILLLGLLVGEGFGQKSDERLRVSVVDLDEGLPAEDARECASWLAGTPEAGPLPGLTLATVNRLTRFPQGKWSAEVQKDLAETGSIRLEIISDRETAKRLCEDSKRPAVLVFGPSFSRRLDECSFLEGGLNPFYRDGVKMQEVDAKLERDRTQDLTASVIEQVAQVSLLRVVLPWMIGKAFDKISKEEFIKLLGDRVRLPVPEGDYPWERTLVAAKFRNKGVKIEDGKVTLNEALHVAAPNEQAEDDYRRRVGHGVQQALEKQFSKFDLTGKTWASLTRAQEPGGGQAGSATKYAADGSNGLLKRGAMRYQTLVPSYTVMFAFALLVVVGWLFVSERRRGTLKRLRAAPVTRSQVLLGKFLPCLALAALQGTFLLIAGKLVFGMRWGPDSWPVAKQVAWLFPVVLTTAFAAMGLSLFVAALVRTEMQVAIYGSVLVMALGLVSGCLWPREQMPENAKHVSLVTPHAWALDAYKQLLGSSEPNTQMVLTSCLVLVGFGAGFLALSWLMLKME